MQYFIWEHFQKVIDKSENQALLHLSTLLTLQFIVLVSIVYILNFIFFVT
jgi:hypothetical protein